MVVNGANIHDRVGKKTVGRYVDLELAIVIIFLICLLSCACITMSLMDNRNVSRASARVTLVHFPRQYLKLTFDTASLTILKRTGRRK